MTDRKTDQDHDLQGEQLPVTDGGGRHYLYDELRSYCSGDSYPLHMPGHKRRLGRMADPFSFDITEIDGFDNLHHAQGILLEAQKRAAACFGAEESFFLVNGSTGGLLAAISACCLPGDKILMARNCHRSVYHGAALCQLETVYLFPGTAPGEGAKLGAAGRIDPADVERELTEHPDIRTVIITSPTYDGVVSDAASIAEIAHSHDAVLIVDEAHGAHFGFHPAFPQNSVRLGADLVIHSVHKTLPSLTGTALLHVQGPRVDRGRLKKMLKVYQTSSPSYVLMASIDECVRMLDREGNELFETLAGNLAKFREKVENLSHLIIYSADDPSRILIGDASGQLSGNEICDILRNGGHLEAEMAAPRYALALMSIGDDEEGFRRLARALEGLDARLGEAEKAAPQGTENRAESMAPQDGENRAGDMTPKGGSHQAGFALPACRLSKEDYPPAAMSITKAWNMPSKSVPVSECGGCVSAEFAYLYPPGIPLLVPGEYIPQSWPDMVRSLRARGFFLDGMQDETGAQILVVCDKEKNGRYI